jgi:hypothetical protein
MAKASKPAAADKPNLWGMIQNIAIASMNVGQFPMVCVAGVVFLIIYKMPSTDVSKLAFKILEHFEIMYLGGWILSFSLIVAWYLTFKQFKKNNTQIIKDITHEKNRLQEILLNK